MWFRDGDEHGDDQRKTSFLLPQPFSLALLLASEKDILKLPRNTVGVDSMSSITIDLPVETYKRLEAQARSVGQDPATLSRELLESALEARESVQHRTARGVLQTAGRVRSLSTTLRDKIIPAVTLEEVRMIFKHAGGPSLGEIIQDQRGPRT